MFPHLLPTLFNNYDPVTGKVIIILQSLLVLYFFSFSLSPDPQELDLPLLKKPLHHYKDRTQAPKVLLDCEAKLKEADAFIVVTAEYNHSIPPALSNLLDHFGSSNYSYKPSGIICYSPGWWNVTEALVHYTCLKKRF